MSRADTSIPIATKLIPSERFSETLTGKDAHASDTPATEWLTAREAARYLKVKVRTVLLWARQGKVKAYPLSGTQRHVWRFRAADLDAMLVRPSVPCSKGAQ